jgi:hypothetical protein
MARSRGQKLKTIERSLLFTETPFKTNIRNGGK